MTNSALETNIDKYSQTHLVCDAAYPLLTNSSLEEEAQLYNLEEKPLQQVLLHFYEITGKTITLKTEVTSLSGGQKVVLMFLLAILSKARNIVFIGLEVSLDSERLAQLNKLLQELSPHKNDIIIIGP